MKIASLLASATEIVYALGLGDQLVAISHECDFPPEAMGKPRVSSPRFDPAEMSSGEIDRAVRDAMARFGSVYALDADALRQLRPDLIVAQAVCEVCAVPTSLAERAASLLGPGTSVVSLDSHTIEDILEGVRAVGTAAGVIERAKSLVDALRARLAAVTNRVHDAPRPTVLALEWLDPPFTPGHWTPEMVAMAGGEGRLMEVGVPSKQRSWSEVSNLDPDVLLLMPCGYGLAAARADADVHVDQLRQIAPRAIGAGRAFVVDGSAYFNRSGPRMVDGVEILGRLLHPDRFPEVELAGRAQVWDPAPR